MYQAYTLRLAWDHERQVWRATVPAVSGVEAVGTTPAEALRAAAAALRAYHEGVRGLSPGGGRRA
jgi:predicted RNase H-like HicB family nuclease